MKSKVRIELSVMMFLQFFIWGAWAVSMGAYLNRIGFAGTDIGLAYSTANWAAVVSPFFIGMVADRFFSAEKVMGVLHVMGAGLMYYASMLTEPKLFCAVLFAYTLCYMPTLALVNAIAFHQMENPSRQFPSVRVLGTLGWIAVGILVSALKIDTTAMPLKLAAGASLAMGFYSFLLPNTPPKSKGKAVTVREIIGLDALKLMKDRSFAVFVVCSLLICIPLAFYYNFTSAYFDESGMKNVTGTMSFGQMSEVFFMIVMPLFLVRLGVKKMLAIGMLAWAVRYALFAFGNNNTLVWMFYTGILLHGVCYDFFFVTGQLYVDRKAPEAIRASAQGFIALVTYGLGMAIGSYISGMIVESFKSEAGHQWQTIWLIPAGMAAVFLVLFFLLFKDNTNGEKAQEA